jgi:hypothetical protein
MNTITIPSPAHLPPALPRPSLNAALAAANVTPAPLIRRAQTHADIPDEPPAIRSLMGTEMQLADYLRADAAIWDCVDYIVRDAGKCPLCDNNECRDWAVWRR